MPQGIFVTTTTPGAGKSLVSLGLADSLSVSYTHLTLPTNREV